MKKTLAVFLFVVAVTFLCGNALALTTYIPHITGGSAGWTDYLQVNNNASSTATFTLTLYNSAGTQVYSQSHSVSGLSRSRIELKALNPNAATGEIIYTETGLLFRVSYKSTDGGVAEFQTIDVLGSNIEFCFSDFTTLVQWKGAAIANMGTDDANITLYALGGSAQGSWGSILETHTETIAPKAKLVGNNLSWSWLSGVDMSQIESIVAVAGSSPLCGIAISGDMALSRLLFTPATPVNYHPVNLQGTWNVSLTYTASSDGYPSRWNYSIAVTLNADGTVSYGYGYSSGPKGIWWSYSNMLIIVRPWIYGVDYDYGSECYFLNLTSESQASGLFEDKDMSGSNWWGRGNSLMTRINNYTSSENVVYHPVNLQGTWNSSLTYTASSDGNPSQWNYSGAVTLNADGTVSFGSGASGIWWSYSNMLIIGHPWLQGVNSGFDCHFLNLTSATQASGLFEDKDMSGSNWWGRGNSLMTKQ